MDEAGVDASPLENKMKKDEELSSDDEEEVSDSDSEEEDDADTIARIQRAHFAQTAAMSQRRRAPARPRPMSQKRKIEAIKNFHDFTKKLKKDTGITMRGLIGKNMLDLSDDSCEDSKSDSDGLSEEEFEVNPSAVHELTEENDSYIDPETGDFVEGKKSVPKPPSPIPEQESLPEVSKVPKTLSISDIINEGDLDLMKNTEISEVEASDLCPEKTAEELLEMKQEQEENSQDYDITDKLKEMGEISVKPVKQEGSDASNSATEAEKKAEEDDKKSSNNALNVRRNIRDVMDEKQLDASTLAAQRQESERLARVQEQQRIIREVQRQIALNRQNKVHQKTLSLLQGGSSILKKSASGHKLNLPNTVMVKLPSGEMKKTTVKQGQVEVTRIPKPGSSGSPGLKLQKTDQKPVRSVSSVVEIVDSSSGGDSSSSSSDSDDCIMLSDSELPPSPEADDDPGNSGLHVNDAYNLPDEQGRVLINMGHPENEEDIFLAPQIARIIKPHQIGGVRFLFDNIIESVERFSTSTGFGCILAHSMGLGKTLQIVCFCDIFLRHTTSKTVLCIMPINTLQNWVAEFNKWLPVDPTTNPLAAQGEVRPRNFPIYVLNDSHKTLQMRAKVVKDWTTTGGVLMIGYELYRLLSMKKDKKPRKKKKAELKAEKDEKEKEKPEVTNEDTQGSDATCQSKLSEDPKQDKEEDPNKIEGDPKDDKKEDPTDEDKKLLDEMYEALVKPGPDLVICDEGHRIKNSHSNISYALKQMRTKRRIVLTGYPLQNNLLEYWCMVDFVRPNYLGSKTEFSNMFERPIQNGQCIDSTPQDIRLMRYRAHVLHSLLVGFVQRRSHAVLQSTLPQKEEYVMLIRFTPLQRKLYDRFMNEVVRCTSVPNPLKAFAICCKIWNHPDVLYNFLKKRSEVNAAIEEDLDLEELGGVTKAGRAARSRAQPRRAAKPRGSAKKPAATITPNTTSSGPANPSGDPNNPYNARYPNSGPPYGPQNQYRPEQPDGSYPPYPYQNSNQGYYPPNQGYNQNYGNNYYPQQQTPYGQNYPQQPYPQNSDQTYNQNYNNWSNGNYYGNSGYYNNAQYPNNQPPQDFNSSQQYPPNYNAAAADQPYHGPGQPPYGNNAGPVQPPYSNNAGATQPPYVDDSGITQPTYPNNSGPNQPPYTNNVAPNQPPYASNAASTATGQPPYPNNSGPNQPPYANNVAPNQPPYASNAASTTTGQPPYPNNSGPNQPPYANNVAPNQPPYASNAASTTTGQPPYPNNSGPNQPPYTNNVAPNQPPYANNVAANQPPYASNSASTAAGQPPFTNSTEAVTPAIQPPYPDPTPATRPPYSNNQDPFVNQQQPPFSQEYPRQDYPGFNANSTDTAAYPAQNQQNYPNPPYQGPYPENSSYGQNSAHPYNPQYDSQQPNYSGFPNGPPVQTPPNDVPPNQNAPKVEPYPLNGSKPDPGSGPPIVPYQNASYNYNQPNTLGYNEANVNSDYPPPYSALPQHLEIKQPLSSGGSPLPTWPITDSMKTENDKSDIKSEPKTEIKSESDSEVKIEDLDTKKIVKDEVKKDTKTEITSPKGKTDNDKEAKKDKTKSGSDSEDDSPKKGKQKGKGREKKKSEPKKRGRKPKARKDRKTSKDKNDESENSDASEKEEKPSKEEELAIAKKAEEMTYDWATELLKDYIPGIIENSAKMQLFFYILNESIKLGDRILLFSQSLFTLNLIEDFLEKNYIPGTNCLWERNTNYYRLDGSTHALEREKLINEFNTNPHVYLFLVSTRAGSLGINLVGANRVIVFDASWNPCHDTQAVCRVYRYGQKKPCFVYRFVMDWCLEKKIYDRQINKQGMADRVVDECNPDAVLSMKEITNLCFDNDEKESEAKDLSEYKGKYIDVIMQGIIADYGRSLSKEPFQHESLLVDRKEKKLSSAEKRLAQRGYELEKKAAAAPKPTTAYRTVRTADGSIVQRPVASVRPMQHGARWIPADVWRRQGMTAQEMTLPLDVVIPTNSAEKTNIVLKAGQRVMVLKSPKGIYMQLESGKIIAIKTSLKGLGQKGGDAKDAAVKKSILPGRPTSTNIPGSLKNNSAITIQKTGGSRPGFQRVMGRPLMGQQKVMRPILPGQRQPDMRSRGDTKSYTGIRRLPMPHGKMIRPNLPGSLSITKIRKDPKPTNDKDASNKMDMESGDAHVLDSDDEVNDRDARNVSNESAERSDRSRAEDNHSEDSKSNDASYHSAKSKDRKEDSSEAEQGPLVLTTDEKLPSEAALERKATDSKNKQPKEQRNKAENEAAKMEPHESKEQGDKSKISLLKNYRHQRPLNRPAESSLSQLEKTASALNPEGLPAFRQNLDHITQSYSPSEEKPIPKSRKKKPTKIEQLDSINDMPIKSSGKSHSVSSLLKKDSPTHRSDLSNSVPIAPMGLSPSPQRLISPLDEPMGGLGHSSLGPSSVPHASMPLGGPVLDLKGPSQPHSAMAMGSSGPAYPSAHPPTEGAYNQYPPGYAMGYGAYPNGPYYGGGTYGTPPFYPGYPAAPYPPQTPHQPAPAPAPEGYPPPSQQW